MNLIDIEAFVAVADHRSIVGAAAALHLTQSAVTRRVKNLEDALGVPLLDRQSRPLHLTAAGAETYQFARPLLRSVGDLKAAIMHNGEPTGSFRFGMPRSLGDLTIAAPIRALRAGFPRLRLHAYVQWSSVLLERLASRSLDAAIVVLPEDAHLPAGLGAVNLGSKRFHIVASRSSRFQPNVTVEELATSQWIVNPHGCSTRKVLERSLLQHGFSFETAVEAEGYELQLSLVAEGVGLGLAMPEALQASAFRKEVKILNVKDLLPPQHIWLLHSSYIGRLEPVIECLRESVKKSLHI